MSRFRNRPSLLGWRDREQRSWRGQALEPSVEVGTMMDLLGEPCPQSGEDAAVSKMLCDQGEE